jgi:hypothetical protein
MIYDNLSYASICTCILSIIVVYRAILLYGDVLFVKPVSISLYVLLAFPPPPFTLAAQLSSHCQTHISHP